MSYWEIWWYTYFKLILTNDIGDKLVAKRVSEKFKRIKPKTLAKLLNGINFTESVYNWNGAEEAKEEESVSKMMKSQ